MERRQLITLWDKYEQIAMHFNELLIRLRTQALGGVATIVTAAGFLVSRQQESGSLAEPWWAVATVSVLLLFAWVTLWIIDVCYYSRLLRGAVEALLDIENESKGMIRFSHTVENAVTRKSLVSGDYATKINWQAKFFYIPVAVFLCLAVVFSILQTIHQG